jgi:ADP-ribose pyrophosphatase
VPLARLIVPAKGSKMSLEDSANFGGATMSNVEAKELLARWRILAERLVYEHRPWLSLVEQDVELPNGLVIEKYLRATTPAVAMVFGITQSHHVIFVEQYKHGVGRLSLDLSAGYIEDDDPSPLVAAQRELEEETGYVSEDWTHLASLAIDPNRSDAEFHFYLARECWLGGRQHLDPTEELRVQLIPLEEVGRLASHGGVRTLSTTAGIALALCALEVLG